MFGMLWGGGSEIIFLRLMKGFCASQDLSLVFTRVILLRVLDQPMIPHKGSGKVDR